MDSLFDGKVSGDLFTASAPNSCITEGDVIDIPASPAHSHSHHLKVGEWDWQPVLQRHSGSCVLKTYAVLSTDRLSSYGEGEALLFRAFLYECPEKL